MCDPKVCWTAARVVRNERWMEREYEEDISNNKPARGTKERKKASQQRSNERLGERYGRDKFMQQHDGCL